MTTRYDQPKPTNRGAFAKGIACLCIVMLLLGSALPTYGIVTVENSLLPVLNVTVSRMDQAVIGDEFSILYLIRNISDKPAYNLRYAFNVMGQGDNYPFTILEPTPEPIELLEPGASVLVTVKFRVDQDARERQYRINGQFICSDAGGSAPVTYSAIAELSTSHTNVRPNLIVTDLVVVEEEPDPTEGFTIRLSLKNTSVVHDLRNIMVQIDGGDRFEIMEISNKKEITKIDTNRIEILEFKLRAKENRVGNSVTLTSSYTYTGGSMEDRREELFIPIREEIVGNDGIPRVIIKRYSLSKEQVLAGDRIDLTLEVENTNARPVKNVLINFGVESTSAEGGGSSSSTVFAPVGSSNTFHVDEISGKSTMTNTITFAVDSGALARTYIVPVTITYEDEKGLHNNLSTRDNVNIPVTQQAKLSVTSMTLPAHATMGMPTPVMAEFVNSGRVDLADFSVRLEGDFELMDATMYMAKLVIGATTSYTGMLIPREEGEAEGTLIVSYLDNTNQEVEEEYPFTISVTGMDDIGGMDIGMFPPDGGMFIPDEPSNPVIHFLQTNWLSLTLLLVIIIQMVAMIRIKKKAKEDFFDE